ncbi:hypothetical protein AKJ42_00960 [candidate division MSBL1 archaeon SCGC-AAA261C02]|uniref:N-acetyltransferase domain-containing protein n=1 Tax=candidate division MSBL1 archaeon SCGC-AAA261C02 TaxID=1698272 RepID=A0A133V1M3_9EURY|nr:hypothetical protein AKJ42_00960 [candidate division MSBL1 archaeon SCGC-AAA261C02]
MSEERKYVGIESERVTEAEIEYLGKDADMPVMGTDVNWDEVMKPYPPRKITLPNGDEMIVKSMEKDEVEEVAEALQPKTLQHKQLFDLIAHELCTELYLWRENRPMWCCPPESHFNLVGRVDDEIVGCSNGVLSSPKVGNSLHTVAILEGQQVGAQLWGCKLEHYFDVLGIEALHAGAESYRGSTELFAIFGFKELPDKVTHFGVSPEQYLTKEQWARLRPGKITGERI